MMRRSDKQISRRLRRYWRHETVNFSRSNKRTKNQRNCYSKRRKRRSDKGKHERRKSLMSSMLKSDDGIMSRRVNLRCDPIPILRYQHGAALTTV